MRYAAIVVLALSAMALPGIGRAETGSSPLTVLESETDDMLGITWYNDPSKCESTTSIFFYFGAKHGRVMPLRLKIRYGGESWIFAKSLLLKVDGRLLKLSPPRNQWKRSHYSSWVEESIDIPAPPALAAALADAKSIKIRFMGEDIEDYDAVDVEVEGLARVYWVWRAVKDPTDKRAQSVAASYQRRIQAEREEDLRAEQARREKSKVEREKRGRLDNQIKPLLDARTPRTQAESPFQ